MSEWIGFSQDSNTAWPEERDRDIRDLTRIGGPLDKDSEITKSIIDFVERFPHEFHLKAPVSGVSLGYWRGLASSNGLTLETTLHGHGVPPLASLSLMYYQQEGGGVIETRSGKAVASW